MIARAVAVDTEPKVIELLPTQSSKTTSWYYSDCNLFHLDPGSANNWAYGYFQHGPICYDRVASAIRAEVNQCWTQFGGFLVIGSLAGGTGSGLGGLHATLSCHFIILGTYFTERLRKDYPDAFIVNQVVSPFNGDVVVQNYNAMLSLTNLYKHSDAILVLHNDNLHRICTERLHLSTVTFTDLNRVIATILVNILLPAKRLDRTLEHIKFLTDQHSRWTLFYDVIRCLCPDPRYKLINASYTPMVIRESN